MIHGCCPQPVDGHNVFGSFGLSTKEPCTIFFLLNCLSSLALVFVHTSPWHRVRHRNFTFGVHMHICPLYKHIKYLVILTCSLKSQPFWHFSSICSPAHIDSHRDFIFCVDIYQIGTVFSSSITLDMALGRGSV